MTAAQLSAAVFFLEKIPDCNGLQGRLSNVIFQNHSGGKLIECVRQYEVAKYCIAEVDFGNAVFKGLQALFEIRS